MSMFFINSPAATDFVDKCLKTGLTHEDANSALYEWFRMNRVLIPYGSDTATEADMRGMTEVELVLSVSIEDLK